MHFRGSDFKNFLGENALRPPTWPCIKMLWVKSWVLHLLQNLMTILKITPKTKKTMNTWQFFRFFGENEFLETSDNLDDNELSLFIEENWNVNLNTTQKRRKTDLNVLKQWPKSVKEGPLKKFLPRNLTTFYVISSSKSVFHIYLETEILVVNIYVNLIIENFPKSHLCFPYK